MCPPEVATDTDYLDENSSALSGDSTGFVIELGSDTAQINVSEGQHISANDPIGYIRDIVVKSQVNGTITEKKERYIIGDYDTDANSCNVNIDESTLNQENEFDEINDILKTNQQVTAFIKDYILRFRFADFAINSLDNFDINSSLSVKPTRKIAEDYSDDADTINEDYEDAIKGLCQKNNVQTHCENDTMLELKNDIDNARITAFNKILNQYRNTEAYGYTTGKISDFMLYDLYMEYIMSDNFIYDANNPYVVELFYNINNFLKIRSRLELNCANISSLVADFNSMCDSTLKRYWSHNDRNYYSKMKTIFQYDFFASDDNDLIQAAMGDKGRVTLYSKVLDYLKSLTQYQKPVSADKKYSQFDAATLMNMDPLEDSEEETSNANLLRELKRIALSFVNLRKIEVDSSSDDYFKEYISKNDLDNIFSLKETLSGELIDIGDYSISTVNPALLAYSGPLKKYLGALKDITDNESVILRELSDRAVNWYVQNYEDIDSGKMFDKFKQAEWPSPTKIKKDERSYDFFFIEEPKTNEELIEEDNLDNGYEYSEDSVKTKYGITSYMYWLRYCTIATLVNCMLPMYWSTGVPPPTGPISLPIIFIPIVVIPGRVITVIGLGICGICPLPMIYFVNVSDTPACVIPAINMATDVLKKLPEIIVGAGMSSVKEMITGLIKTNDTAINEINKQIEQIDMDCYNLSVGVKEDMETKRALRKRKGLDSTSHKRKNET